MATYKAIANGNADTLSIWEIWDGAAWVAAGSLPTTTDDVYTNNNIVTVTTSQAYKSWNRSSVAAPYSITQGGQFQINGANDILISGEIYGSNANLGTLGFNNPLNSCVSRLSTHTGALLIIGNQNGGSTTYTTGFFNSSLYELNITGNQNGGAGSSAVAVQNNGATNLFSITGNQNGGAGANSCAIYNRAGQTPSITGNQNGGAGSNAYAIYNEASSANLYFIGNCTASGIAAIYNAISTSTIIYTGNIYNALGVMAIRSDRLFLNVTPTTVWEFSDFDGDTQYLYGAGVNTGHPIEADVRKDVVYGPNDEFTGTLVQPPFTIADFIAALKADDLGKRLGKCATTEEVDMTVAAYNS